MSLEVQNLSERLHSGSDDLDLLFNDNDGVLMDDTFISFNNTEDTSIFGKPVESPITGDDLFSNLLNDDFDLTSIPQNAYEHSVSSPLNSDSGISDGINSPQYHSDSQSGGSPQRIDELEEVLMTSADMSSYLIGSDMMLMEESAGDSTDFESVGYDWDLKLSATESKKSTLPMTVQDVRTISAVTTTKTISTTDSSYPKLRLTDEEKRLLVEMNVTLPTDMPLTKEEERSLKTVRRKIRNKISAMDSRKRKKVYVDGLEHRVHLCTKQNQDMQKKMAKLESQNKSLMEQLRKLQSLVSKTTTKAAQAGTCVMVLLLSFALLIAPSFNPLRSSKGAVPDYQPSGVVSRTLKDADLTLQNTLDPYSYSTDPSILADQKLSVDEPIATGHFAKSSNQEEVAKVGGPESAANVGRPESGATVGHPDSEAIVTQAEPNEVVPSQGLSNDEAARVAQEFGGNSNGNQSHTDTGPVNAKPQQANEQQVKRTQIHGDEM